jgi:putative oxidoreductase
MQPLAAMDSELAQRADLWSNEHRTDALDLVRMFLGLALFVRGGLMIADPALFATLASGASWAIVAMAAHYVVAAHLVGGLLLALGLTTRLAALVQVPVLMGAVFLVHWREGLATAGQSLELSMLVLFLLLLFSVFGAGRLSVDRFIFGLPARLARTRSSDLPVIAS